jgi:3-oxoacyl-[acyl-carrier protein] reductase
MNTSTSSVSPKRRIALVTGGTRGIGFGICQALAQADFDLVVGGQRPEAQAQEALDSLRALGAKVAYAQGDVSLPASRAHLIQCAKESFGALHVLVNNAGVSPAVRGDLLEADEADAVRLLRTNMQGPFFLTRDVARWMVEQHKADSNWNGAILFISSVSASVVSTARGAYCMSKAGLAMAAQLFAARLGEFGIPVYDVRPGITATDMTAGVKEKYDNLIANGLLVTPRWGLPEDVGRIAAFLAAGSMPYSTGAVIPVDGGLTMPRL